MVKRVIHLIFYKVTSCIWIRKESRYYPDICNCRSRKVRFRAEYPRSAIKQVVAFKNQVS